MILFRRSAPNVLEIDPKGIVIPRSASEEESAACLTLTGSAAPKAPDLGDL